MTTVTDKNDVWKQKWQPSAGATPAAIKVRDQAVSGAS